MSARVTPSVMRAWQYLKCSPKDGADDLVLQTEAPVPSVGPGELLIRVHATSMNIGSVHLQSGILRPWLPATLPFTPGFDVSGEVLEVGPKAEGFKKGDQVFGHTDIKKGGGFAEFALLPANAATSRPAGVSPVVAACMSTGACVALQGLRDWAKVDMTHLEEDALARGETPKGPKLNILIANASGGVGLYAVQLAKLSGCHVTATCGQRNMDLVRSMGADEVLDYKTPEGEALRSPSGVKYDVLFDCSTAQTFKVVSPVLTKTGIWVQLSPSLAFVGSMLWNTLTLGRQKLMFAMQEPHPKDLSFLGELSARGVLKTHVQETVPFERMPEAWQKCMDGHITGKVVVVMDENAK